MCCKYFIVWKLGGTNHLTFRFVLFIYLFVCLFNFLFLGWVSSLFWPYTVVFIFLFIYSFTYLYAYLFFTGSKCYFVNTTRVDFFAAQLQCQSMRSRLVSIHSSKQNADLTRMFDECDTPWIGLENTDPNKVNQNIGWRYVGVFSFIKCLLLVQTWIECRRFHCFS